MQPSADAPQCVCGHVGWGGVKAPKGIGHFQAGTGACKFPNCQCKRFRQAGTGKTAVIGAARKRGGRLRHVSFIPDTDPVGAVG